jgi:hypothetical protein
VLTDVSRWFLTQLIFSTLKMGPIYSSETSVDTQQTTWRYIPEDGALHTHCCENLNSYLLKVVVFSFVKIILLYMGLLSA